MTPSTPHRPVRAWALLALLAVGAGGCQSEKKPIGGETHFLSCASDAECLKHSATHICVDNFCQLPEPVAPPPEPVDATPPPEPVDAAPPPEPEPVDAAPPPEPVDAAPPPEPMDAAPPPEPVDAAPPPSDGAPDADVCAPSGIAASEVVILGDSFFGTTHEITAQLERLASEAGVQPDGEPYRDYSRLVNNALAFMGNGLADQYTEATSEGSVRVVIMNGGGADALLGTCDVIDSECPLITAAATAAEVLLARMAEDGVENVVYAYYPDALDEPTRLKVDALRPLIQDVCAAAVTQCHFVDLRPTFEGNYDTFVMGDGRNPTTAGSAAAAAAIWATMQANCIAQ